eukprot:279132-Pleurochrysis_carterae.AAC.1
MLFCRKGSGTPVVTHSQTITACMLTLYQGSPAEGFTAVSRRGSIAGVHGTGRTDSRTPAAAAGATRHGRHRWLPQWSASRGNCADKASPFGSVLPQPAEKAYKYLTLRTGSLLAAS